MGVFKKRCLLGADCYRETRSCWWSVGVSAILDGIWQKKEVKRVWERQRIDTKGRRTEEKMILELSEGQLEKIRSHMNPPEPKGVIPPELIADK